MDNELQEQYEKAIATERIKAGASQLAMQQNEVAASQQDKGLVHEQLDVSEILDRIHYLLRGYVLQMNKETKNIEWVEPKTNDEIVLSEHGINYIMGSVQWYLNKNTLLSNYDDVIINQKMEDFAITIIDNVFMEYDKMFLYPTLDECYTELEERIAKKVKTRKMTFKLQGVEKDEAEIKKEVLKEMEGRFDREITTIKEQKVKNKLKRFDSLMRFVQDTVHSCYQRAWKGQERTTLRQHIHISENKGGMTLPQQQGSWNPLKMFSR